VIYGIKRAPAWIVTLDAAHEWGIPPWKIEGGSKVLWYARFEALRTARIKRVQREQDRP